MKYIPSASGTDIIKEDYAKKIIVNRDDLPGEGHLLQTVTIPPKTRQRVHFHDQQTELFYILEGECHIFINGHEFLAKPGDSFVCSPKDRHNLWNQTEKDFTLLVFKINLPDTDDTHWEN